MTSFDCPSCGKMLSLSDESSGRRVGCPHCSQAFIVPTPDPTAITPSSPGSPLLEAWSAVTQDEAPASSDVAETPRLDFLAPPQMPDELGRLGSYRILNVLGVGGMGFVLQAEDSLLKRPVALKVMRPEIAADQTSRQRFLREAQATAAIDHHHIVHIHRVGEENGVAFIEMPLLKGEPLDSRLAREKRLPVAAAVMIGKQIAEGLAEAHKNGLIHRDIKPANIWLSGEPGAPAPVVKIVDFGLARAVAGNDVHLTKTGMILGTPAYMAPEQARSEQVDFHCDLFSLGAVLYRMLTGELPFKGHDAMSMLLALAMDAPPPISSLNPEVPPALADLVMKLLAKDPVQRPVSAKAVAEILGEMSGDRTLMLTTSLPAGSASNAPPVPSQPVRPDGPLLRPWPVRRAGFIAAVLGVMLVVLLLILMPFMSRKQDAAKRDEDNVANRDEEKPKVPEPTVTNTIGMKFVYIPPGKFMMGSSQEEIDAALKLVAKGSVETRNLQTEGPQHEVEITRGFFMGETEVTVGQFRPFAEDAKNNVGNDSWKTHGFFAQTDDHPVVFVDWNHAVAFCTWLSKKEGKKYRLPTEAEWEYCCRAGKTNLRYCFGDDDAKLADYGWSNKNASGRTNPVGKTKPNEWGLYDMHGNAMEWCQDNYDPNYYKNTPPKDPPGPGHREERVVRGGSWNLGPVYSRSAFRNHSGPGHNHYFNGFRVVLAVPAGGVRP